MSHFEANGLNDKKDDVKEHAQDAKQSASDLAESAKGAASAAVDVAAQQGKAVRDRLRGLLDSIEQGLREGSVTEHQAREKLADGLAAAREKAADGAQKAGETAAAAREKIVDAAKVARDKAVVAREATRGHVRENPLKAISAALVVGAALGLLASLCSRSCDEDGCY